ncbi:MAG TPA: redoxin domain-containing protein [Pseudomonadales bacterium]
MLRILALAALVWAVPALALGPGDRVEDFRLLDHRGQSHHLYYFGDAPAIVLMTHGTGCPMVRDALPGLQALRDAYAPQGVEFFLLNSKDGRDEIAADAERLGIDLPVLLDPTQLIGESLAVDRTAEVLVIDPATWTIAYRGAAGPAKGAAGYVKAALDDLLAGRPVQTARTEAVGCAVELEHDDAAAHARISYSDQIAPILIDNCVSCHRPGGIGPWAMTGYEMVRGFAPMIREVIRTQRMPPWHADPAYGHFANDRRLTEQETRTLVHWIEAGAPRGNGDDPLVAYGEPLPEWGPLGEPDLIIEIPPTDVPASGVVDYQYKYVKNPLDRDVWVRASQILPGDRAALHHVITRFGMVETEGPRKGRLRREGPAGGLSGYVPGWVARELPEGTGTFLPADATIEFQMHYTTYGKATTDRSRIGIYFHDEPPEHPIETMIIANPKIRIPAGAPAHKEYAERAFETDVLLYSLLPHAHYRGKASEFRAIYPDGREEVLLSVPNYDFNWQTTYELAEPKPLPAGTRIVHSTWWDNSPRNPANPDPTREVPWGEQSWDEMLFGAITYRELEAEERADLVARRN